MLGRSRGSQYIYCHTCKSSSLYERSLVACPLCNSDFIEECKIQENPEESSEDSEFSNNYPISCSSSDSDNFPNEGLDPIPAFPMPNINFLRGNNPPDLLESIFMFRFPNERNLMSPFMAFPRLIEVENQHRRHQPASEQSIALIDSKLIDSAQETECTVCTCFLKNAEIAKVLRCGHCFHENCLIPWLKLKNSCPVCRKTID